MTISVRVASAAALAQLKAVEAQSRRTSAASMAGGAGMAGMNRQISYGLPLLSKWGNQVQWAGRQLMYNFTLPIALAMGMATKFALDNEKAFTRVAKVYGDNSKIFNKLAKTELPALADAFEALSNKFGVAQSAVINIAADWAAAGASGIALAKSVDLTLQTMILGELEAGEATKALIAIQAQFGFAVDDNKKGVTSLTDTIDILNMVENQTGANMADLIQGLSRSAGVARNAGIDIEHLSAMMASLVPATGSAASAGNGLKTVISRILSPTREGIDVMKEMGIEVEALAWQSMNGTQRLEAMAKGFKGLSDAQKVHVSTVLASRWQVNRFSVLMADVTNKNGYYQKALRASSDELANFKQKQKELNLVLESNPQKLKQTWIIIQNAMANVIQPLLPAIIATAQAFAKWAKALSNLDPGVQKLILAGLVLLALIGPIARYVGSLVTLFGILSAVTHWVGRSFLFMFTSALSFLLLPFKLIGGLIARILLLTGVTKASSWANVVHATSLLAVRNAMLRLIFLPFAILGKGIIGVTAALWKLVKTTIVFTWLKVVWAKYLTFTALSLKSLIGIWKSALFIMQGWLILAQYGMSFIWAKFLTGLAVFQRTALGGLLVRWGAWLTSMRIYQAVWAASSLAIFKAWMARTILLFNTGWFLGYWSVMTAAIATRFAVLMKVMDAMLLAFATRWKQLTLFMVTIWTKAQVAIGGVTAGVALAMKAAWAGYLVFWRNLTFLMTGWWILAQYAMSNITSLFAKRTAIQLALLPRIWAAVTFAMRALWFNLHLAYVLIMAQFKVAYAALGPAIVGIWAATTLAMKNLWFSMYFAFGQMGIAFRAAYAAITAPLIAAWAAVTTVMRTLWFNLHVAYLVIMAQFKAAFILFNNALTILWFQTLFVMRVLWMSLWASMLKAPLLLLAGMRSIGPKIGIALVAGLKALPKLVYGLTAGIVRVVAIGFARLGPVLLAAIKNPIVIGIAAAAAVALGIFYRFRNEIQAIWTNLKAWFQGNASGIVDSFQPIVTGFNKIIQGIVNAFWALPDGVRSAMIAVYEVVKSAAMAIYDAFSWMNPWAKHSPRLVDEVKTGMDAVAKPFERTTKKVSVLKKTAKDLKTSKVVSQSAGKGEWTEERSDVAKGFKKALPIFDELVGDLGKLNALLAVQGAAVAKQEGVVARWQTALDRANNAVDRQQEKLDRLSEKLATVQAAYDAHASALDNYASAPIKGMGRMEDKIFANELAQKKLRLEMLKMNKDDDDNDKRINRLQALRGEIELLRGQATALRNAGAGSEVTGPIEAQIALMEAQTKTLNSKIDDDDKMQKQLEELERKGEILALQQAIKFDPMIKQIGDLADTTKELSFQQIVDGIKKERAAMEQLQPKLDRLNRAVEKQENVLQRATDARDKIQSAYDREAKSLDRLSNKYRKTEEAIRSVEEALRAMSSVGSEKIAKVKSAKAKAEAAKGAANVPVGVKTFRSGAGANFPDVGGQAKIGREGGMVDQAALIEEFTQQAAIDTATMFGKFDMFGPIKRGWKKVWSWMKANIGPVVEPIINGVKSAVEGIKNVWEDLKAGFKMGELKGPLSVLNGSVSDIMGSVFKLGQKARTAFDAIVAWIKKAWGWAKKIGALFGPDLTRVLDAIGKAGKEIWTQIGPELAKFGKTFGILWQAIKNVGLIALPILIGAFKLVATVISVALWPILKTVIRVIANIIQAFRGLLDFVLGIFAGNWKAAFQGLLDFFAGIFGAIGQLIWGAIKIIGAAVWGIVVAIWETFKWLWNILLGNSIIPDIVNGIVNTFKGLVKLGKWIWNNVLKPIYLFFKKIWIEYIRPFIKDWWTGFKITLAALKKLGSWVWENVLKPVWSWVKKVWTEYIRPFIKDWWTGFKITLAALKKLGSWVWENVLKPVWTKVKNLWTDVKTGFGLWWQGIKNVWDKLKRLGNWVWENVLKPIKVAFVTIWHAIRDWFIKNGDMIVKPIKGVVNLVIGAINSMIRGLNKISDVLPGIDWEINLIPKLAAGGIPGRRVGSGFKANQARAIVGEGKSNYPEYVIPTDPTHRKRAKDLWDAAGSRLGVPAYAGGGILGAIGDAVGSAAGMVKDGVGWIGKNVKSIVSTLFKPFKEKADKVIDTVDWKYGRESAQAVLDTAWNWIKNADKVYAERAKDAAPKGGNFPVSDPSKPTGHTMWRGGEFTNRFIAHMKAAEKLAKVAINVTQGGFRPTSDFSGTSHHGDAIDLQVNAALIRALRRVGIAAGDRTGLGDWGPHTHAIPGPGAGYGAGSAIWQWDDYIARGGMNQALDSSWGLADGAIVRRRSGGVIRRLGEGGRDEAVTPLPHNWRTDVLGKKDSRGETHIHINGNLEFPNITSGDDAESFIKNLELLAKD